MVIQITNNIKIHNVLILFIKVFFYSIVRYTYQKNDIKNCEEILKFLIEIMTI